MPTNLGKHSKEVKDSQFPHEDYQIARRKEFSASITGLQQVSKYKSTSVRRA